MNSQQAVAEGHAHLLLTTEHRYSCAVGMVFCSTIVPTCSLFGALMLLLPYQLALAWMQAKGTNHKSCKATDLFAAAPELARCTPHGA